MERISAEKHYVKNISDQLDYHVIKIKMLLRPQLCVYTLFFCSTLLANQVSSRRKGKFLIFPPTSPTRAQLIYGIGIPVVPLEVESMTSGWVLKAEYFLPTMAKDLRPLTLNPQPINNNRALSSDVEFDNSTWHHNGNYGDEHTLEYIRQSHSAVNSNGKLGRYRWAVYGILESLGTRMGLDGRACMLRTICEVAEAPFHYGNGLLGELLHIILTPSSSEDPLSKHSDNEYFHAEILGRSGASCGQVFKECTKSLLSIISTTEEMVHDVFS